jgi:hypothetical protein
MFLFLSNAAGGSSLFFQRVTITFPSLTNIAGYSAFLLTSFHPRIEVKNAALSSSLETVRPIWCAPFVIGSAIFFILHLKPAAGVGAFVRVDLLRFNQCLNNFKCVTNSRRIQPGDTTGPLLCRMSLYKTQDFLQRHRIPGGLRFYSVITSFGQGIYAA